MLSIGYTVEDITQWREDMNFMFEWQEQYLMNLPPSLVRYFSCHENIKFISSSLRVMCFLICKQTDDGVFVDFPNISEHFPKIFVPKARQTFPNIFREFSKMPEDAQRLPKTFRGRPEDVSVIHH